MNAKTGYINIRVKNAVLTRDTQLIGKIDPYVSIEIGKYKLKTTSKKNGGLIVQWNQNLRFQIAQFDPKMKVTVFDDDGGRDDVIGQTFLDISPYVKIPDKNHQINVFLQFKNKPAGQVKIEFNWSPSNLGRMYIKVLNATFLKDMDTFGKQDPYIKLIYGKQIKRTTTKNEAGKKAQWNQQYRFQILNLYQNLLVQAYDDDGGNDDFIGQEVVKFEPLAKITKKYIVNLKDKKKKDAGEVFIQIRFQK